MLKVVSENLWETIQAKAKLAAHRRAAIAYVHDSSLLPLRSGDTLVTDASDDSIASGRTSALVLEEYLKSEVELFSLSNLHAKVVVLDDIAVVGSANASHHSANFYVEAAVVTDRPELVGQADAFISSLTEAKESKPIDPEFIVRILKIPVTRSAGPTGNGANKPTRRVKIPSFNQKVWLISLRGEATYPGDAETAEAVNEKFQKAESGFVDWFWFSGKSRFFTEAKEHDVVIESFRPRDKITTTRSVRVYRHGRIKKIFQEPGVKAKTFHCVWPPDYEESAVSWSSFLSLAKRAGITRKLSYKSTIELTDKQSSALFEIWPT